MTLERVHLNVGAWQARSRANGPGERFVLWLQGCPLLCPGCFNEELLPFVPRHNVIVEAMADIILAVPGIEGVTYSGGEPTIQARGLALLSERLHACGLTVMCYTGYTLDALQARKDPWIDRLLASVDILIDGPFVRDKARHLLWRGSSNQRVHFLTETYRYLAQDVDDGPAQVEFAISREEFLTTGTWPQGFLERLREVLER